MLRHYERREYPVRLRRIERLQLVTRIAFYECAGLDFHRDVARTIRILVSILIRSDKPDIRCGNAECNQRRLLSTRQHIDVLEHRREGGDATRLSRTVRFVE